MPCKYTERILKRPKNKGIEGVRLEIYTFFTPLETRKPKRKTIPIENILTDVFMWSIKK